MSRILVPVYRTARGVLILAEPGQKTQSEHDFIVRYQEPGRRVRTPRHIHLVIDLYLKREHDPDLTHALVDHIIDLVRAAEPSTGFPPHVRHITRDVIDRFAPLDDYGEYPVEFILAVAELIMVQEKTNYPDIAYPLNLELFESFRRGDEIFRVVSTATFRGAGGKTT